MSDDKLMKTLSLAVEALKVAVQALGDQIDQIDHELQQLKSKPSPRFGDVGPLVKIYYTDSTCIEKLVPTETFQEIIGCSTIQSVRYGDKIFIMDEEARLKDPLPPINTLATQKMWQLLNNNQAAPLLGTVIVMDARP